MVIGIKESSAFPLLLQTFKEGGLAIMPCDTIYGIVGIAPGTGEKIRALKGREEQKPLIQLILSPSWLNDFTDLTLPEILEAYWPGPLTLIFPTKTEDSRAIRQGISRRETVALRVPKDPFLQKILQEIKKPLFSTSVNKSGQQPLWRSHDIIAAFAQDVDLIVDSGDLPDRAPSTILDISSRPYRLIRQGVVKIPEALFK